MPTEAGKSGEVIITRSGKQRKVTRGFWPLDYGNKDGVELEEKVNLLLGKLSKDLEIWRELIQEFQADVFCGFFIDNMNEGFGLSPELMKKLAGRNLEIGFDIYSPVVSTPEGYSE
jgi:hypothetical protein